MDARGGIKRWDRYGSYELGDTRTHTYHWLHSMATLGSPDLTVTANTPFYAVFKTAAGKRTYMVYNAARQPVAVTFADGKQVPAAPAGLSVH